MNSKNYINFVLVSPTAKLRFLEPPSNIMAPLRDFPIHASFQMMVSLLRREKRSDLHNSFI